MFILLLHFPFEEFQRSDLLSDWQRLMRWYTKRTPYLEHHKICEWTNACDSLALSELWLAHQIWLCNDNTRIQWININEWNDGRWWWLRVRVWVCDGWSGKSLRKRNDVIAEKIFRIRTNFVMAVTIECVHSTVICCTQCVYANEANFLVQSKCQSVSHTQCEIETGTSLSIGDMK